MKSRGTIFFQFVGKSCRNPFIIPMKHLEKENKNDVLVMGYLKQAPVSTSDFRVRCLFVLSKDKMLKVKMLRAY